MMQSSVWSLYLQQQQLAFLATTLGLLLVHVILKLFLWLVGIFLSQQAKLQMRPLRIPMEHDERGNKANGKDGKPFLMPT